MTLSITGRCPTTGQLGAAVSSYDCGWTFLPSYRDPVRLAHLSLAVAGVGAITAQALTPASFTTRVLGMLREGLDAREALDTALAQDEEDVRDRFQVAVVDAAGCAAAFTGERPGEWRGHRVGEGWVAAGNILAGEQVVEALGQAFEANADVPLVERLLAALEAGVAAGGDRRGQRGALLRVATGVHAVDLEIRVHEHAEPVAELRRILVVYRQETDIIRPALKAAAAIGSSVAEAEVQQLADMTTYEAASQLRKLLAERDASRETLETFDQLLAALSERQDVAEAPFGDALKLISAATLG